MRQPPENQNSMLIITDKINDIKPTFSGRIGDVFGAFFTTATWWRVLKMRGALEDWTCFLYTRELLSIALTLNTRILCKCYLAFLKYILPVQVTA